MKMFPTILIYSVLTVLPATSLAEPPQVRFDVPQTLAVRDVTTREFAFVHPHERLVEVRVPISMLLARGEAKMVRSLRQRVESGQPGVLVYDYFPKTMLGSQVVGTTRVEKRSAHDARISLEGGGTYYGLASGTAAGDFRWQGKVDTTYELLPALDLLAASGTVDRGRGVYFKLQSSPRSTLEGAYEYVVILRVPRSWRAGIVYVQSDALAGESHPLATDEEHTAGRGRFVVALYQQGDLGAQAAAQKYAWAESLVRQAAARERSTLKQRTYPTLAHKLGVTRDGALDRDWLEDVVFRGSAGQEVLDKLPGDVRAAVETLLLARRALVELNATSPRGAKAMIAG